MAFDIINKYFDLTDNQRKTFSLLPQLYEEWNTKINTISRKDIAHICERHILHSLAIAKVCRFGTGARVLDVGSGGGFPGIPLAIMFPETEFTLVDSIGKKIKVIRGIAESSGLNNVTAINARAESIDKRFDYVVSRAVTDLNTFTGWVWKKIDKGQSGELPNGILYLKGGDLQQEISSAGKPAVLFNISDHFEEEFFETKKIVYLLK